jgi:hypothetical protein
MSLITSVRSFESSLTTSAQQKRFDKLIAYFKTNPLSLSEFCDLNSAPVGVSGWYVSLGSLISALDNREFGQFETQVNKVLDIGDVSGVGVIFTREIIQPIEIGYTILNNNDGVLAPEDSEVFEVNGGTHRTTFILLAYLLSGHDIDSEEVKSIKVRVRPAEYSVNQIVTSNGSRSMTAVEKGKVKLSIAGIESDVSSIIAAYFEKKMTRQAAWQYAFAVMQESEPNTDLTPSTVGKIASIIQKNLSVARINGKPYKFPIESNEYEDLFTQCYAEFPKALKHTREVRKITNIARDGVAVMAQIISDSIKSYKPVKATLASVASPVRVEPETFFAEIVEPEAPSQPESTETAKLESVEALSDAEQTKLALESISAKPATKPGNKKTTTTTTVSSANRSRAKKAQA